MLGFAYRCNTSFANVTYTFVDGVYDILNVSDVSPQTYGAWAFYASDGYVNSLSPPPAGQISVQDGISNYIWGNVSPSAQDYTVYDFRAGLEAAIRNTEAAWLKGAAAPAPATSYQVRTNWPLVTRVPKASLIALVFFNCLYSLLGVFASVHAIITIRRCSSIFQVADLFSNEGLARAVNMGRDVRLNADGSGSGLIEPAFVPLSATGSPNTNASTPAALSLGAQILPYGVDGYCDQAVTSMPLSNRL